MTPSPLLQVLQVLQANFPNLTLTARQLQALETMVSVKRLARGRTLFAQGQATEAFYAVLSGEIETRFTAADGSVSVLEHVQAPRLFGLAAFAAHRPSSYEALAERASQVLVIGHGAYEFLMDQVPGFARALMAEFAQRYDGTLQMLEAARHRTASERFAFALSQLLHQRGTAAAPEVQGDLGERPTWRELRTTQAELAALANLSRQSVNQLIRQACEEGRLKRGYGSLWVRR